MESPLKSLSGFGQTPVTVTQSDNTWRTLYEDQVGADAPADFASDALLIVGPSSSLGLELSSRSQTRVRQDDVRTSPNIYKCAHILQTEVIALKSVSFSFEGLYCGRVLRKRLKNIPLIL